MAHRRQVPLDPTVALCLARLGAGHPECPLPFCRVDAAL